jgi:hypothetical protein
MMHAGLYSIPATTKRKRLHPLAIKARGCTALERGGTREDKKRKQEERTGQKGRKGRRQRDKRKRRECKEERGRGSEQEERKQREGETNRGAE